MVKHYTATNLTPLPVFLIFHCMVEKIMVVFPPLFYQCDI